jgi:hypothetical protein
MIKTRNHSVEEDGGSTSLFQLFLMLNQEIQICVVVTGGVS